MIMDAPAEADAPGPGSLRVEPFTASLRTSCQLFIPHLAGLSQSSLFVIVEPGPAEAGAVKAITMATVRTETMLFMTFSPLLWTEPLRMNVPLENYVPGTHIPIAV